MSDPFASANTSSQPVPPTQVSPSAAPPYAGYTPPAEPGFSVYSQPPGANYQAYPPAPAAGYPVQQPWGAAQAPLDPASERSTAVLTHVLAIFFSFIPPLIFYILNKDRSQFVREHSRQALNWQITRAIADFVGGVLSLILIGFIIIAAVEVANLIFCILAALKANQGQDYKYPLTIPIIQH